MDILNKLYKLSSVKVSRILEGVDIIRVIIRSGDISWNTNSSGTDQTFQLTLHGRPFHSIQMVIKMYQTLTLNHVQASSEIYCRNKM